MQLTKRSSIIVSGEPGLIYEIVSDFGAWSEWFPGIASSKVIAQELNFAIVELEFAAKPGAKITVECVHAPTQMVIVRSLIGNKPQLKWAWNIKAADVGRSAVALTMNAPLSRYFSSFFHPGNALAGLLNSVAAYGGGPSGDKIIEITEGEDGLICWYQGTRYQMKELP
jgi:hypothetical protein